MMKEISQEAELSTVYTNHCVRATAITLWSQSGLENRQIMAISGHRNESSLRSYNSRPSVDQLRQCSDILSVALNGKDSRLPPRFPLQSLQSLGNSAGLQVQSSSTVHLQSQQQFSSMFHGCPIQDVHITYNQQA